MEERGRGAPDEEWRPAPGRGSESGPSGPSIRGRGAAANPPNRFLPIAVERAGWSDPDDPGPRTRFLRDRSRTILSRNDSPDVGFDVSLNPYRGCECGCVWCLAGDSRVLMADGTTRALADLHAGDEIYGTVGTGYSRRLVVTRVHDHWSTTRIAYRVTLADGTALIASGDHRFLSNRGWKFVYGRQHGRSRRPHLTPRNRLVGTGAFVTPRRETADYRVGYLCGMIRGDGLLATYRYERPGRSHGDQYQFRLALVDPHPLDRCRSYLRASGVQTHPFLFRPARRGRRSMPGIRTHARPAVERIQRLIAWEHGRGGDWHRGFLAGVFDAEGSYSGGVLRISNTSSAILDQTVRSLARLGFASRLEGPRPRRTRPLYTVRLCGGLPEQIRFFLTVLPAIPRKKSFVDRGLTAYEAARVVSVEPLHAKMRLYDITTGTGDFIANGVVSHNCYARPTHEYLGFSAGLDWETKIVVKEDAPELLRRELASPRWKPQVIAMSGVTDPYQPVERRLGVTRRCLEVLAEFRNPVAVITKRETVTRDLDLLAELAGHDAASVSLSITSLDDELQRRMEPRASAPERRLAAVRKLAGAGVPVGVMAAPVIPGLNDHEIPAILERAAEAGARRAAYVMLRLPHGLDELFADWLERHYPDRKEKVLNRLRSLRGGRLNDPRFGIRMKGEGPYAEQVRDVFRIAARRAGLNRERRRLSTAAFRRPPNGGQLALFE